MRFIIPAAVSMLLSLPSPGATQSGYLDVDGARLYYEVDGEGPPLVLVNGWIHNVRIWDLQVPDFRRHHRVIRWDRRGFGRSTGHADVTADAADLEVLLTHLGVESAAVLGWSAGGIVALSFAQAFPHRVHALILYGSGPPTGLGVEPPGRDSLIRGPLRQALLAGGVPAARPLIEQRPGMTGRLRDPRAQALVDTSFAEWTGADVLDPRPNSNRVTRARMDRLSTMAIPTLVLVGDTESPFAMRVADSLAAAIPGAEKVVIPGGGHGVSLDEPERFNAEVLRFLRRVADLRPAPLKE